MAGAGMMSSPYSAGRYPFPQTPMPMQPMNPMMMGMMGQGGGGGMIGAGGGGMMGAGAGSMMGGGPGMMGGMGGGAMNPLLMAYLQQLYLEMLFSQQEDGDDTGVWDGDDEEGADVLAKLRRRRGLGGGGRRGGEYYPGPPFLTQLHMPSIFLPLTSLSCPLLSHRLFPKNPLLPHRRTGCTHQRYGLQCRWWHGLQHVLTSPLSPSSSMFRRRIQVAVPLLTDRQV